MAEKSMIIIGAGLAGLSAGCYAQRNDYQTRIFELHNIPGGLWSGNLFAISFFERLGRNSFLVMKYGNIGIIEKWNVGVLG